MADFLTTLAARSIGQLHGVMPRQASRFERAGPGDVEPRAATEPGEPRPAHRPARSAMPDVDERSGRLAPAMEPVGHVPEPRAQDDREDAPREPHVAARIPPDLWQLHWALMTPRRQQIALQLITGLRENLAWFPHYQVYLRQHQPPTLIL